MKKISLLAISLILCSLVFSISFLPNQVNAKTTKKITTSSKKKPVSKIKTSMKWTPAALKALGSFGSFDYNNAIRNAYIKKIEAYAKKKKAKTVTPAIVNSFRG